MSDVESDEGPPPHPALYELPDIPFDEMSPLQKRWHKIKAIPEFPVKVVYLGDCEMPLEYVEYLSEDMRKQAFEVFDHFNLSIVNLNIKQAATEDIDIGGLELKESGGKKKSQSRGGRGAVKAKKKAEPQKVKVGRVSRGKKKAVTHVTGLHSYEVHYSRLFTTLLSFLVGS